MAVKKDSPMISIIVPTKDEPYIQALVGRIHKVVKQKHEVIVVDKSDVLPKIPRAKVIAQQSDGLGNAFLEGLSVAKGDVIVLMDGDGSHRPEDVPKLLTALKNHDVALGSKFVKGGKTFDSPLRQLISKVFALITRVSLNLKLRDPLSGFAVFKRDVFKGITLKPRGFKIVLELIYKSKADVVEVPITFEERKAGQSHASSKEVWRLFMLLKELRFGK